MLIPVRCFTCGKVGYRAICCLCPWLHASYFSQHRSSETSTTLTRNTSWRSPSIQGKLLRLGESLGGGYSLASLCPSLAAFREAMDRLKLKRYCCRRMILTHVDLIEKLLAYQTFQGKDTAAAPRR